MKRAHLNWMVAGVGTAVGAVMLGSFLAACAPGTLCDKPGYEDECLTGGSGGGTGGSGGSTGGSAGGSTGGSAGGSTGGSAGGGVGPGMPVANCVMAPTVGEVETKIIAVKCGETACHVPMGVFKPDLKTAGSWARLLDKVVEYSATKCKDDVYIKKSDPLKSYFLSSVKDAMPKCSDGRMGGVRMPFGKPPLSAEEITCIEGYVKALAGAP
jgi:hypothetical protein